MPERASPEIKAEAKHYGLHLTRKSPRSPKRIPKSEAELKRQLESRKKNWARPGPKCRKTTVVVSEKKAHCGAPCPKGQERTASFCVKKTASYSPENTKWIKTLSPNRETRLTLVCPK